MELSYKQKNIIIAISVLIAILLFFILFIKPTFDKNNSLNKQFQQQTKIAQYLRDASDKLNGARILESLTVQQAKNTVNSVLNINKSVVISEEKIIVNINKQNFSKLINSINTLRNNYGIVVTKAEITKADEGLVNAELILSYL